MVESKAADMHFHRTSVPSFGGGKLIPSKLKSSTSSETGEPCEWLWKVICAHSETPERIVLACLAVISVWWALRRERSFESSKWWEQKVKKAGKLLWRHPLKPIRLILALRLASLKTRYDLSLAARRLCSLQAPGDQRRRRHPGEILLGTMLSTSDATVTFIRIYMHSPVEHTLSICDETSFQAEVICMLGALLLYLSPPSKFVATYELCRTPAPY